MILTEGHYSDYNWKKRIELFSEEVAKPMSNTTDQYKVKAFLDKLNLQKKKIRDAGIDTDEIDRKVKGKASEIAPQLKNNSNPEKVSDVIAQSLKEIFSEVDMKDVPKAVILTFFVVIVNTFFLYLFMLLLGPISGYLLTAILIGPIVEEAAKTISINEKMSGTFFIVFNIAEFCNYVFGMGVKPLVRLIPVAMHLATTIIQKHKMSKALADGKNQAEANKEAFFAGVAIHSLYNFMV